MLNKENSELDLWCIMEKYKIKEEIKRYEINLNNAKQERYERELEMYRSLIKLMRKFKNEQIKKNLVECISLIRKWICDHQNWKGGVSG